MDYSCLLELADLSRDREPVFNVSFLSYELISAFFEINLIDLRNRDDELKRFFEAYKLCLERIAYHDESVTSEHRQFRENMLQMLVQLFSSKHSKLDRLAKSFEALSKEEDNSKVFQIIEKIYLATKSEVK